MIHDIEVGALPATPIMRRMEELGVPIRRFCQSMLLRVPAALGEKPLRAALQVMLDHHDVLRLRLRRGPDSGEWNPEIAPPGTVSAEDCARRVEIGTLKEGRRHERLVEEAEKAIGRLDPDAGLLMQAVWFDAGPEQAGRLLLIIHHLAIDGVSWRILAQDLKLAWEAIMAGRQPELAAKSASFRQWAMELSTHAQDVERVKEMSYWTRILNEPAPCLFDGLVDAKRDRIGDVKHLTLRLPVKLTGLVLGHAPAAFKGNVNDVLLTALAVAVAKWRRGKGGGGSNAVLVDLESHGREEIFEGADLSRTVGWFTNLYPVRLDPGAIDLKEVMDGGRALWQALKAIKEQLRKAPDRGLGYGMLRYLNPETAPILAGLAKPQILFNYLGRFASPEGKDWAIASEAGTLGGGVDAETPPAHCLEVNAVTLDHGEGPQLSVTWTWVPRLLSELEVRGLAEGWFQALGAIARHVAEPWAEGHTHSDFP
jgi:non-ribosomal peptide synthase protein (TIGR01720 family)